MDCRSTAAQGGHASELDTLNALPRRVYGHLLALPNRVIGDSHKHDWIQLSYASQGVLQVTTEEGRFTAPPRRAVWVPAGVIHAVSCSRGTEVRSLYIQPSAVQVDWTRCRVLAVQPLLRELIRSFARLPEHYDEQGPEGRLVDVLLDQLVCAPEAGLVLPWPRDARLRELCAHLQKSPHSTRSLGDFARQLNLSDKTVSRLFLQETGLSFRLWRQRARLLAALPLLERGDRVTDVALACGYESLSAFIAAFRLQMGATPSDYFARRPRPGPPG